MVWCFNRYFEYIVLLHTSCISFCHAEFLLKMSTMAKPPNCSLVRMCCVLPVMGEFALNVIFLKPERRLHVI